MEEKEYTQVICGILDSVRPILEEVRKCIFTDDRRCLEEAEKRQKAALRSSLPLAQEVAAKKEKSTIELKFLTVLPLLQKLGIEIGVLLRTSAVKVDSGIPFTNKGLTEIKDVMLGAEELARDVKDAFLTRNPHLGQQIQVDMSRLHQKADDFSVEHEDRLIKGICSPKASYLYLGIMECLKKTICHLAGLSQEA